MDNQKILQEVKQSFMLKRVRALDENEAFIQAMCQNDEFNKLYTAYNSKNLAYLRSKFAGENSALKSEVENLKAQLEAFLEKNNIDKSNLQPKYECPICNDTGIVNGKMCNCLLSALNSKKSILMSGKSKFKSFADCDDSIMTEQDFKTRDLLKTWCEKYPNGTKININILGASGAGKTFLLECMANALMAAGHNICFKTAFELNELARQYHIGKSYDFSNCLQAEVLFIDDLGSEPMLKNVTKEYLYNLINTRQSNHLPTVISTNLDLNNLLDRYDERIFSRLVNKRLSININLTSPDKRLS